MFRVIFSTIVGYAVYYFTDNIFYGCLAGIITLAISYGADASGAIDSVDSFGGFDSSD